MNTQKKQELKVIIRNEFRSKTTLYTLIGDLGCGSLSQVKLVRDGTKFYALKIISKQIMEQFRAEENVRNELLIQIKLNHKHIIKIQETFEDDYYLYIVLEHCAKGNLYQRLQQGRFTEKEVFDLLHQVLSGLDYLHSRGIVHRDIKPDNILIHEDGTYKICDFGWSIQLLNDQVCDPVLCGTTEYMPPEVIMNQPHDYKIDIWSLGVVIYETIHGKTPFGNTNKVMIMQNILKSIHVNERLEEDLQILIYAMLTKQVHQRPSCKQIFLCKWMKKYMKLHNIFNKYENESLKIQQMSKQVEIKTLGNSCFDMKKLKNIEQSENESDTTMTQSNQSTTPMISVTQQEFLFDSIPKVENPAFPQF
ncbi:hypothetical protein pb186bvf_013976 [Paramecium bursaria]